MLFIHFDQEVEKLVQARMGSTRLPGKVLKKIDGRSILDFVIERLRLCRRVDDIVLAIPDTKENDLH